jgi:diguanylate cyclase (GGDEF)-like protein
VVRENLADVLSEFARTMVTDFPIQAILDHLVKRIVEILPITAAGVTLIAPGLEPEYVAASDQFALRFEMLQTELSEGPCLVAYETATAISVPNLAQERRFPRFTPRAIDAGLAAVFTFPLRHQAGQLGALDLYRDAAGPLSEESTSAAQTLADVITAYLLNAQARADLEESTARSREAALHDPLTGLPNRVLILQLLDHASRAGRRSGKISAVLMVDIDRFKQVNDRFGHQIGDELLVALAARLTGLLRPADCLARLSGDEFVILCEDLDDESGADPIASRLSAEIAPPFLLSGVEVRVSASIGIAFTGSHTDGPEALLHDADLAMYRSKRERELSSAGLDLRELHLASHQASLARGLSGAIDRGELHLDYQPIVAAADRRLVGVEALARWTHASRGVVSPAVFIPFAEQSGQIVEIGRWALHQAWTDRAAWESLAPEDTGMWVNVSTNQFMSAGFVQMIAAAIDAVGIDPSRLTLEVTESMFVGDQPRARIVMKEVKRIGVQLALDDFGMGYSSMGVLDTLPIDVIKIDQRFVQRLDGTGEGQAIVRAIITLAHGLGMTVVCEGVETAGQFAEVLELGSDLCQGYYFGRPMDGLGVANLLRSRPRGRVLELPLGDPGG